MPVELRKRRDENRLRENMNGNVNNKSVTVQSGKLLGDILAAHDISDFVMQVESVSPASPMLGRGAVVCRLANGFIASRVYVSRPASAEAGLSMVFLTKPPTSISVSESSETPYPF
jgi:hypothetical protein